MNELGLINRPVSLFQEDLNHFENELDEIIKNWNKDINNKNIMSFNPLDVNSEKGPIYISKPTRPRALS